MDYQLMKWEDDEYESRVWDLFYDDSRDELLKEYHSEMEKIFGKSPERLEYLKKIVAYALVEDCDYTEKFLRSSLIKKQHGLAFLSEEYKPYKEELEKYLLQKGERDDFDDYEY